MVRCRLASCALLVGCGRYDFERVRAVDAKDTLDGTTTFDAAMLLDGSPDVSLTSDVPAGCPAPYVQLQTSATRYRVPPAPATWIDAANACAADGANTHLVVIGDEAERSLVQAARPGVPMWIGLSDRHVPDAYQWVTAEPVVYPPISGAPWDDGQPSMGVGEDCVRMNGTANFDDAGCAVVSAFACECDEYADDPTRH